MTWPLGLSLRGAAFADVAAAAVRAGLLPARAPDVVDDALGKHSWGDDTVIAHAHGTTLLTLPGREPSLEMLDALPFEVAVFGTLHVEWLQAGYRAPSFGLLQLPLGWACAFRGAGHERLVSRRWLAHGPWRFHARAGDLSVVEFHDRTAGADAALAEARVGHQRMGITDEGGYLQQPFAYTDARPRGFYDAATGRLDVAMNHRSPTPRELLEACALRVEPRPTEPGKIAQVAYVFFDEELARANLRELWLRELECRLVRGAQTVRID